MSSPDSPGKTPMERFQEWDRQLAAFKKNNPGESFTKVQMEKIAAVLKAGGSHPTLGKNIDGFEDWWQAGASTFAHYCKLFSISPGHRLVDYGCGSLRVGAHFIRYLDPGCYFGVELASGLYELGQEVVGPQMLAAKAPRFGLIGAGAVAQAAGLGADFVYSTSVAFHVHPDELPQYHENLVQLTAKPGASLFFDTKISDKPLRYRERAWAWPLEMYLEALAPLQLVRQIPMQKRTELGVTFENRILEFRRL